jgi:DNA replication protein DnaC
MLEGTLPLLLKQLKLARISSQWQEIERDARANNWDPAAYLFVLAEQEVEKRHQARLQRLLQEAQLPVNRTLSAFDWNAVTVARGTIESLAEDSGWLERGENLLLFGPSGVGKTHLACGICHRLIEQGQRVRFFAATALVQQLQQAKRELGLARALSRLDRHGLLVIDDMGYVRRSEAETSVLFELISHRYERRSLLVTSNQPFSEWEQVFDNTAMSVAAVDRLIDNSTVVVIEGQSYRRRRSRQATKWDSSQLPISPQSSSSPEDKLEKRSEKPSDD